MAARHTLGDLELIFLLSTHLNDLVWCQIKSGLSVEGLVNAETKSKDQKWLILIGNLKDKSSLQLASYLAELKCLSNLAAPHLKGNFQSFEYNNYHQSSGYGIINFNSK